MGGDRLTPPHDRDFLVAIMRKHQRATKRHFRRFVTANDGVFQIKCIPHQFWLFFTKDTDVALLHFRRQLTVRQNLLDKHGRGFFKVVVLAIHESEKTRLLFFNR